MRIKTPLILRLLPVLVLAAAASMTAQADISFSFGQGDLAASVTFIKSGDMLTVELENTSAVDVSAPGDVLTGLFFDIDGFGGSLTRVSAIIQSVDNPAVLFGAGLGNTLLGYNDYIALGDIGAEVGYRIGASGLLAGTGDHAIGHVGMDDFMGTPTRFDTDNTHNIQGPLSPNGIEYGIVNAAYTGGGNAPVNGPNALLRNSILYKFTGFNAFSESDIGNIQFNFGTEFNPIPAPGAALLGVLGLAVVNSVKRRFP